MKYPLFPQIQATAHFNLYSCQLHHLAPRLQTWLKHRGSMTRLMKQTGKNVTIKVIQHQLTLPKLKEMQRLHVNQRRMSIVREIYMYCDNEIWLFGQSIIPLTTLQGKLRRLHALGNIPLGKLIFAESSLRRSPFIFSQITPDNPLFNRLITPSSSFTNQSLWQRESLFYLHQQPLLLTEVFLPPMLHYLTST